MKKRVLLVLSFAFILSGFFAGCKNPSSSDNEETTYKIECGTVSKDTYSNAISQLSSWNSISYQKVAALRLYLYNNTLSDHEIQNKVTLTEIKNFLSSKGMSDYELKTEIEFLQNNGNDIGFFEHATDATKRVWVYATK